MKEINKDKYNYKLEQDDIVDICTTYMLNSSKKTAIELGKKYNVSDRTIYTVVNKEENKKLVDRCIKRNSQMFAKKCDVIINNLLDRISSESLDKTKDIDINKLTTTLGILYDKSRLESGLSTENKAISINIKVDK